MHGLGNIIAAAQSKDGTDYSNLVKEAPLATHLTNVRDIPRARKDQYEIGYYTLADALRREAGNHIMLTESQATRTLGLTHADHNLLTNRIAEINLGGEGRTKEEEALLDRVLKHEAIQLGPGAEDKYIMAAMHNGSNGVVARMVRQNLYNEVAERTGKWAQEHG
jgi:hypothetical protein